MNFAMHILRDGFIINPKMLVRKLVIAVVLQRVLKLKQLVTLANVNNYIFK
jgi:hypothetical protein